jgi:hypothetical protein
VRKFPGAAALLLCLALLGGCSRSAKAGAGAPPPGSAPPPAAPSAERATPPARGQPAPPGSKQPPITLSKEQAPPRPQPGIAQAGTASLLTLGGTPRLLPEDFSIGPLAGDGEANADEKAALASGAMLLASLLTGTPDGTLLTSGSEKAVLDLLDGLSGSDAAPTAFRMGRAVSLPDGEISANVRLFRGEGSAEGEIYLRKEGSRWLVADVQINPAALAQARQRPGGRFFPSPYRWLLGE